MRDGTPVGSIRGSLYLPKGYIKANGATVNRADYPRLVKLINDNNLWTDDTAGNLGLFGKGDGSTTFVLPNLVGRMMQMSDSAGKKVEAGLPNITGEVATNTWIGLGEVSAGALYNPKKQEEYFMDRTPSSGQSAGLALDASRSSSIYGSSTTVQPPAITYIPIIRY